MTIADITRILRERTIHLSKGLGQNFLHDAHQLDRILAAARVTPADTVLEIGPGLGPVTARLAAQAKHVTAVEKDRRLFQYLQERFAGSANVTLVHADALDYLASRPSEWRDWKMVSNLPYSVGSRILVALALMEEGPALMTVTLQSEVARRLAAAPGSPDYGVLTLLLQQRYEVGRGFRIPSGCFFPAPEVDSTCVTLSRRAEVRLKPEQVALFARLVKRGFSQRRKMMFKLLKVEWPAETLECAFDQAGLSAQVRAEQVPLAQWVDLTKGLS